MLLALGDRAENQATLGHGRFEMSLCIMRREVYVYGVKERDLGNKNLEALMLWACLSSSGERNW